MISNIIDDYYKCMSVIDSCNKQEQLDSANRLIENFYNKWAYKIKRLRSERSNHISRNEANNLKLELYSRRAELHRLIYHKQLIVI